MRRAGVGLLLLVVVGCQAPTASVVTAPTETAVPVAASVSVWGEVPKACT